MSDSCHIIPKTASVRNCEESGWSGMGKTPSLGIDSFRPESTSHRPRVRCKLLYDDNCLYGLFQVLDRYVRCIHTGFQTPVCEDSCVEVFMQPRHCKGLL